MEINWFDFSKGGIILVIILVLSFIGIALFFERLFYFLIVRHRIRSAYPTLRKMMIQKRLVALNQWCATHSDPLSNVILKIVRTRKLTLSDETGMDIMPIIDGEVSRLNLNLRSLSSIASIAPLLGLLGTVVGMIQIFNAIQFKGGLRYQTELAGGIGKALTTTVAGLVVAITLTICFNLLREFEDRIADDIYSYSYELIALLRGTKVESKNIRSTIKEGTNV